MTIPKEILEKAIAGGWYEGFKIDFYGIMADQSLGIVLLDEDTGIKVAFIAPEIALDSLFWQALGKSLGWWNDIGQIPSKMPKRRIDQDPWNYHAHRFYDLILTGGNTDAFWQELLS